MEADKITQLYFSDLNEPISDDRRKFLKQLGKGIIVVFSLSNLSLLQGWSQNNESGKQIDFNAFLRVNEDGTVDCFTGKIEMGQGIITSLAQVLAEELEVSMDSVRMIMGDTNLCPYDAGTWGSLTTRFADPVIRAAAAEAREVLLSLAADKFNVVPEELQVSNGIIFSKSKTTQFVSYAELTKGKTIIRSLTKKPDLKYAKDFKIIGKPILSTDALVKVTGKAVYAGDVKLPGMVHASIIRPTAFKSKKIAVFSEGLQSFKGVELIEDGDLVAVVHADPEVAQKAARKVKVTWKETEIDVTDKTIFNYFDETITESSVFESNGDIALGKKSSNTIVESQYYDGYKSHAPIETHSATCYFEGSKLIMWASTQTPFGLRSELAKTFNISEEDVHVKQVFIGGGFGGKIYNQQAVEAAKISKLCGKPVQVVWSRKEEFTYNMFRPAALIKTVAGLDSQGKINSWEFDIYCAGTRGTKLFYEVPHNLTRSFNKNGVHPFGTGAWRAPGNNTTTFARESFIDVLAHKSGMDPLEFRLLNLKDQNMLATLKLAAETFNWQKKKKEGHGYGIALGDDAGTCVAMIAEVFVDKTTGIVKPIRVVCAQDMGQVVNPHGAIVQTEGGITMGLGYALYEDIEFKGSTVQTQSFGTYKINQFSTTPIIECVFIDKMDAKPQGGGEPAIICVGGAIANAVFDACGARVNQMPVTPERILEVLKNG